jgi:hypothetical protein
LSPNHEGQPSPRWFAFSPRARETHLNLGCEQGAILPQIGIIIVAWGSDLQTVEAKAADRGKQISTQLAQLGFIPIQH